MWNETSHHIHFKVTSNYGDKGYETNTLNYSILENKVAYVIYITCNTSIKVKASKATDEVAALITGLSKLH